MPSLRDWAFAAYGRPGVEDACLELQDCHGMDVVVVLWCVWAGRYHGTLEAGPMAQVAEDSGSWHDTVVAPLRRVRRHLKQIGADVGRSGGMQGADPHVASPDRAGAAQERLRRQVADAELAAEVIQLDRLGALTVARTGSLVSGSSGEGAVRTNLALLVDVAGPEDDAGAMTAIDRLLTLLDGPGI